VGQLKHIEFDSLARFVHIAEQGKFDFLFLAEGLRLWEQNGRIYDPRNHQGRPVVFQAGDSNEDREFKSSPHFSRVPQRSCATLLKRVRPTAD